MLDRLDLRGWLLLDDPPPDPSGWLLLVAYWAMLAVVNLAVVAVIVGQFYLWFLLFS